MDLDEDILFQQNKVFEEKINYLIHIIENRIDRLFRSRGCQEEEYSFDGSRRQTNTGCKKKSKDPYSSQTFMTFRTPYIRDFRNFSGPVNEDSRQLQRLPTGMEDVDKLGRQKVWSKEGKTQLREAVLENYARNHLLELVQQKNQLLASQTIASEDVAQKVRLIDEQAEQVRAMKEPRIFVPENRFDTHVDWCAVSAKLSSYFHDAKDCRLMWSNQLHWTLSDSDWTKDEDICLINAVTKHGNNDWDLVAHELNTGRASWQCCSRYHQHFACVESNFHPESDETEKIIEVINLCRIGNFVPWNQVMYFIQFHSLHQVKHQWQRYLCQQQGGPRDNTRIWSQEEDLLLLQAVARYGEKDWARVADCVPGRTNKSCRERYMMRTRFPKRAVGSWRPDEDSKLLSLVQKFGPNWSALVEHFFERNNHQLRNRYELLKNSNSVVKRGPIKHRKLYRSLTEESVDFSRGIKRSKPVDEIDVDKKLNEILTTYVTLNKTAAPKKSLTCRSFQDEQVYQCFVEKLCDALLGLADSEDSISNLDLIMAEAVNSCISTLPVPDKLNHSSFRILTPSKPTLQAFKAWRLQQDYLSQFKGIEYDKIKLQDIDERITKIILGIFLLPAILSKLGAPEVDVSVHQISSVIDKQSKNLYKIRNLQSNLLIR